jgi:hypothetical protein
MLGRMAAPAPLIPGGWVWAADPVAEIARGCVWKECPRLRSRVEQNIAGFVSPFGRCRATLGV